MKLINKKAEREKELQEVAKKKQQAIEETCRKRKEAVVPQIGFITDWKVEQEYTNAIRNKVIFAGCGYAKKQDFLRNAIKNRSNLKALIIEKHEPIKFGEKSIKIDSDSETIETLNKEARKNGLSLDEYIRAIYYSTAKEINQKQDQAEAKDKARAKETQTFKFEGEINQELKRKLESKFGKAKYDKLFGFTTYGYGDMLIELAKEYFRLEAQHGEKS